jgi:hypothetical protein
MVFDLMSVADAALKELQADTTPPPGPQQVTGGGAFNEFMAQVERGRVAVYHDNRGGLYPGPTCAWTDRKWIEIQDLWFQCYQQVFDAVARGEFKPVRGLKKTHSEVESYVVKRKSRISDRHKASFRLACQWILPRLSQLRSAGWSLRDMFGVDSCAPPWGSWGLSWSWSSSWSQATEVILEDGAVCFRFHEADRIIEQRSRPP